MTETNNPIREFINYLLKLAREENRGALSDLRSGLRADPGLAPRMYRRVVPYLGERQQREDRWFYVVGAMFGANPRHVSKNTMGKCFKALSESGSDSIEKRFIALLGSHPDDLHLHLYHATGLLESKEIGVDYYRLMEDLMNWNNPGRVVQNKWARDYYHKSANDKQEEEGNVE